MKIFAFNGSPRKEWNTAMLLSKALEGSAKQGATVELIHLYDLTYKGCNSCFDCKEKGGKSYGKCSIKDDLRPILKKLESADAIIFGSPIYLGNITGEMQSFLERLIFPYLTYTDPPESLFPKKLRTAFVYTMGVTEELFNGSGYMQRFAAMERTLTRIFGSSEILTSFDTYQFEDYSKYVATRFNADAKLQRRQQVFPKDMQEAFKMGVRLAT